MYSTNRCDVADRIVKMANMEFIWQTEIGPDRIFILPHDGKLEFFSKNSAFGTGSDEPRILR